MKTKFKAILKSTFLTSIAALTTVNANADNKDVQISDLGKNHDAEIKNVSTQTNLQKKLLLKFNNENSTYALAGHRSHRSHSSHRSHYSSYNTNTSTTSNTSTLNTTSTNTSSSNTTKSTDNYIIPTKEKKKVAITTIYKLGDRILKKGMKGPDVTELLNILVAKKYIIPKDDTLAIATGDYEFTLLIENAVKAFQKDKKIKIDGIVEKTTVYFLKKEL